MIFQPIRWHAYAVGARANVLHVRVSTLLYSVPLHDVWLFHPSSHHFGVASVGAMCEVHEEQLSSSDDDEEGHNTWNVFLDLITSFDPGARIRSSLADEELGRFGLSCHCAMDCLCAELYAL